MTAAIGRSAGQPVVAVLDIGSSRVCCLAVTEARGSLLGGGDGRRLIGVGVQRSDGVKAGLVVDIERAEKAVKAAVDQCRRMAGADITAVELAVACGRLETSRFTARAPLGGRSVEPADLERLAAAGRGYVASKGRTTIHLDHQGYSIDGHGGIRQPLGLAGEVLGADLTATSVDEAPLKHLVQLIARAGVTPSGLAPTAFASALAVTTPEERRQGVACIDIGGGTTSIAVLFGDRLQAIETIPVGGMLLTYDVARHLQTPLAEAERIKVLYGSLLEAPSDAYEHITYPLAGRPEGEMGQSTKAEVCRIVRPRVEMMLGLARERLAQVLVGGAGGVRVVLTGGGSQLIGLAEVAARVLASPVRVGRPVAWKGVPASVCTPAFAAAFGLVMAAGGGILEGYRERRLLVPRRLGPWRRVAG
jgi:cell division protein FtsA